MTNSMYTQMISDSQLLELTLVSDAQMISDSQLFELTLVSAT